MKPAFALVRLALPLTRQGCLAQTQVISHSTPSSRTISSLTRSLTAAKLPSKGAQTLEIKIRWVCSFKEKEPAGEDGILSSTSISSSSARYCISGGLNWDEVKAKHWLSGFFLQEKSAAFIAWWNTAVDDPTASTWVSLAVIVRYRREKYGTCHRQTAESAKL